jgi:hypothetical protein
MSPKKLEPNKLVLSVLAILILGFGVLVEVLYLIGNFYPSNIAEFFECKLGLKRCIAIPENPPGPSFVFDAEAKSCENGTEFLTVVITNIGTFDFYDPSFEMSDDSNLIEVKNTGSIKAGSIITLNFRPLNRTVNVTKGRLYTVNGIGRLARTGDLARGHDGFVC